MSDALEVADFTESDTITMGAGRDWVSIDTPNGRVCVERNEIVGVDARESTRERGTVRADLLLRSGDRLGIVEQYVGDDHPDRVAEAIEQAICRVWNIAWGAR